MFGRTARLWWIAGRIPSTNMGIDLKQSAEQIWSTNCWKGRCRRTDEKNIYKWTPKIALYLMALLCHLNHRFRRPPVISLTWLPESPASSSRKILLPHWLTACLFQNCCSQDFIVAFLFLHAYNSSSLHAEIRVVRLPQFRGHTSTL